MLTKRRRIVKTVETVETEEAVKVISLEGLRGLRAIKTITYFSIIKRVNLKTNVFKVISKVEIDKKVESLFFPFIEITPEELNIYRKKGVSSFVLKIDENLYYSKVPSYINLWNVNILGEHICGVFKHECRRLSAACDENGGCEKVRNLSNNIERYPWITKGYETFNTTHDMFVVTKCLHYIQ